jgi:hypothetical protein
MTFLDALSQATISACGVPLPDADTTGAALSTLDWMEQSAVGVCVAQSAAGYYIALAFHALGMGIVVGTMLILDWRVLGWVRGIAAEATASLVRFAWFGLIMNALSGVALFFSEANKAYYSLAFRIKILLMLLGVVSTIVMNKTVFQPSLANHGILPRGAKAQAWVSMALWLSVIIVGRMMSYLSEFTVS